MKKELQDKLYKKYPEIFRQKDLSMQETCMCWGIECRDGWYDLINAMCSLLQFNTERNGYPQIEATQVKEKFGTLRFYYELKYSEENKKNEWKERQTGIQKGIISLGEFLSGYICENCGINKKVKQTRGWVVTLCEDCLKERRKEWDKKGLLRN